MKKLIVKECTCPVCGSSRINYDSMKITDEVVSYPAQCEDCGATYYEDYVLNFCGISEVRNKDGERLGVVINLIGEEECPID